MDEGERRGIDGPDKGAQREGTDDGTHGEGTHRPATNPTNGGSEGHAGIEFESLGAPQEPGTTSPRMLVPLFLVPLLIVGVIVGIFFGVSWLVGHEETLGELITRIETGGVNDRWQAASKLTELARRDPAELADPQLLARLRQVFKVAGPEDTRLRRYFAILWGRIGDREAVPVIADGVERLREMLAQPGGRDSAVSEQVSGELIHYLLSLGTLGGDVAETAILTLLDDPDPGIRKTVAAALGEAGRLAVDAGGRPSERLLAALLKLHDDSDVQVRMNAAISLAKLGRAEALPTLELMLDRSWLTAHDLRFPDDGNYTVTNHDPAAWAMVAALLAVERLLDRASEAVRSDSLKKALAGAAADTNADVQRRAAALLKKLGA